MIAHLDSSRRLRAAVLLGAYAAAIALAPDAMWKGLLILPLLLVLAGWWLLLSPIRWVTWFLASAVLLPPLPMALGTPDPTRLCCWPPLAYALGCYELMNGGL